MRVAMIGTGYVGLVSGACFADFGHHVTCVDKDADKIELLQRGKLPIYEPGLDDLVEGNVRAQRLSFTTDLKGPVAQADAVFIAVGTPSRRGDGHADLSYVFAAAEEIGRALVKPSVVVTKSTVPVGTGDEVERILARVAPDIPAKVVSNPEFLREGAAINDFKRPDRIVVGTDDEEARQVMRDVYRPLSLNQASPILFTGRRTAEPSCRNGPPTGTGLVAAGGSPRRTRASATAAPSTENELAISSAGVQAVACSSTANGTVAMIWPA